MTSIEWFVSVVHFGELVMSFAKHSTSIPETFKLHGINHLDIIQITRSRN